MKVWVLYLFHGFPYNFEGKGPDLSMNTIKTAGIIAEYNPFHNGHHYQIEQVRRQTGADYVIAVMSGDFVQRGEPAIFDKYTRTNMALRGGADLVVELHLQRRRLFRLRRCTPGKTWHRYSVFRK